MRVLCICPIGIGNYLLFYPACSLLKRRRPDLELSLLGLRPSIRDIAENDPLWSRIHIFDPTRMTGGIAEKLSVVRQLRAQEFDAGIAFFPANKWQYNLLPFLVGIPRRYGFRYHRDPPGKLSFLCTDRLVVDVDLHDLNQNIAMAWHVLGEKMEESTVVFPSLCTAEDDVWAGTYLRERNVSCGLAVHAGSSEEHGMAAKRWQADKFAFLADRMCERLGAHALLFGGPEEAALKEQVAAAMKAKAHVVDAVSLRRTAALIKKCRVCLCNDSGLMHIAGVTGVPTVAIFGPTDEKRNGPVGCESFVVRGQVPGFPVWTAANVGSRGVPKGTDPGASLRGLSGEDAWDQVRAWLDTRS